MQSLCKSLKNVVKLSRINVEKGYSCSGCQLHALVTDTIYVNQLLSVACLSLAAKTEETEVPLLLDLQIESKYVFEARTIQRMELLVLSTLKWRMQAVTPFSFIDYFLHKFNDDNSPTKPLISRAAQLILSTARGIEFLAFRPSEIAAAFAMSVLGETQMVDIEKFSSFCNNVDEEKLLRCYEVVQEVILMKSMGLKNASSLSIFSVLSPNWVFDAGCSLTYDSKEMAVDTHENSKLQSFQAANQHEFCLKRRF
ncbi:cyclin-D3-1-like [Asparagus officinalis]|uniref:cyclin-D3-1-like n=1 Tax=Asparagus officinalis TaxID=4686 RepID=UPI00098E53F3|nr:cyclin-D3-1-like [Asparagus officinalis]